MSTRLSSCIATVLTIVLIAPSAFFVAPQRVHAQWAVYDAVNWIENSLSAALDVTSTAAEVAQQVNAYVLEPLAFVLSGDILKAITAGVISFVIGEANGTGVPQFVVDVQETLRTVSDGQALAFFNDFERNSNSPFASSIRGSLQDEYLSKSSLAGYWARNMSTLRQSSNFYNDNYLRGDWSRGGLHAWFALTTRTENNPYTLHQSAQRQLQDQIGHEKVGAVEARIKEIGWGNGFLSWCGGDFGKKLTPGSENAQPGDDCYDENGNKRKIQTPGTVITEGLNKALGSNTDKVVRMGNVGPQVNQILSNLTEVAKTISFANNILGGGSGGLFGAGQTSSSQSTSRLAQFQQSTGYLGATQSGVYNDAISSSDIGADLLARTARYETAWNIVKTGAVSASSALTELKNSCTNYANTVEMVLTGTVSPALAQAFVAENIVTNARLEVSDLRADIAASSSATTENFLPRVQALQTMSPTNSELADALQKSQAFGGATSTPAGSITVSDGSLIDQLELLRVNAATLKTSCAPGSEALLLPLI